MSKRNLILFSLTALFIIAVGSYYVFYVRTGTSQFDIRKFNGNIIGIEGKTVMLHGRFSVSESVPEDVSNPRDFSFQVDDSTQFEKTETRFPTWKELQAMGKVNGNSARYNLEDLPQIKGAGSLDDLKSSMLKGEVVVEANFTTSIYRSINPVANFIFYHVLIEPSAMQ